MKELPRFIDSGCWNTGHCQGIAVDLEKGFVYYSFTTTLVKTDLQGRLVGTVSGLLGHLGCIDFCEGDGRVYGSLEYKSDAIGRGILAHLGREDQLRDAFYAAIFDVDRIDRPGMDATADGVMTTVYLREVVEDYHAQVTCGGRTVDHRHGCSGIDGLTFGPFPGSSDGRDYLFVTYGVYSDLSRADNDYQVMLCYDAADWRDYERPLSQASMHESGPAAPRNKLFVYTGNTTYGVQNLEYDAFTRCFWMAVYPGEKPEFPNHALFAVDGTVSPRRETLRGVEPPTEGEVLTLKGAKHPFDTPGFSYPLGSTGLFAVGDGRYYLSEDGHCDKGWFTRLHLCRFDEATPFRDVL